MAINITSPVTGSAQAGLTSPTYTVTVDTPKDVNGKQWAVTALGGTQTGVEAHSASNPFTLAFWRPKVYKALDAVTNATHVLRNVPKNIYGIRVEKGMEVLTTQPRQIGYVSISIGIPAGADVTDPESVRAMLSAAIGSLQQVSSGLGDTCVQNIL